MLVFVWVFIGIIGFVQSADVTKLSKEEVGAFIDQNDIPGVAKGAEFIRHNVRGDILMNWMQGIMTKNNEELWTSLGIHDGVVYRNLRRRVFEEHTEFHKKAVIPERGLPFENDDDENEELY